MAQFDIIDAAGFGYRELWRHRRYLARLAAAPLLIEIACQLGVTQLGKSNFFLREALVTLPSLFAQGWMLAHYVRFLFLGQVWPFRPSGVKAADRAAITERMRGIGAGTLFFVLPQFLLFGLLQTESGTLLAPAKFGPPTAAVAAASSVGAVIIVGTMLWSIRLVCLYVPAALGSALRPVLRQLRGFRASLCLLGAILVSFVPLFALVQLFLSGLNKAAHPNVMTGAAAIIVDSLSLIAANLVVTGAISYGMRIMLGGAARVNGR